VETKNRWGFKILESVGDARLMITHNFRLGFFHTLNFISISYDSSSQGGYPSLM